MDKINTDTQSDTPIGRKNSGYAFLSAYQKDIDLFNDLMCQTLQSQNTYVQPMIDYITSGRGKRIRPLIVFLSARLCGDVNRKTMDYALIMELIHTATLLHDDVVDNTMERRNLPSVNAKFDNKAAVLLGDYILSLAIRLTIDTQNFRIMAIMAGAARGLVDGELSQLVNSRESIADEQIYLEMIRNKTAVLLSACTQMGGISSGGSDEEVERLRIIGENLGICFQIRDDIFDYYDQKDIGKPTGNDIREGKITLPLLFALNSAPEKIASEMKSLILKHDFSPETIATLISFAKEYGGIEYAHKKMREIKAETIGLLDEFPDSEAKKAMTELIDYIIDRDK